MSRPETSNCFCLLCILICAQTTLLGPSLGWGGGRKGATLLHMANRNCSSATGNNLHADGAGLGGTLTKFSRSLTYCKPCTEQQSSDAAVIGWSKSFQARLVWFFGGQNYQQMYCWSNCKIILFLLFYSCSYKVKVSSYSYFYLSSACEHFCHFSRYVKRVLLPLWQLTHMHTRMDGWKDINLWGPHHTARPVVCLIRAQHICGLGSLSPAHRLGGGHLAESDHSLSAGGESIIEQCTDWMCCSKSCRPSFL